MKHLSFIFIILPFLSFSQKIKKLPVQFSAPIFFDSQSQRDKFVLSKGVSSKEYWLVIGDRPKVALYDNPKGNPTSEFIDYGQTAYVIDESGEWIKIGIGSREDNRFRNLIRSGWLKKADILLWPKCLRDKDSFMPIKAIIVQNLSEMVSKTDRNIKIYDGPTSSYILDDTDALQIYFIYKEEAHRVLIGTTDFLSTPTARDVLVGWVDAAYIQRWNSRLALECNWEEPSYGTRRNDPNKRVYGFADQVSADLYSKTGFFKKENILWDNDPAKSDYPKKLRSEENSNRAVGDVYRFPVLNMTTNYIKTLGIARSDDNKMAGCTPLYIPMTIRGVDKPYKYVVAMSEGELEEYIAQLRQLVRSMSGPKDAIREELYNTLISFMLNVSSDKRIQKQIDNLDLSEFMGWIMDINRKGIEPDLKGISIKDILDKKKLSDEVLTQWASNLSSKEKKLSSVTRQQRFYPYSYSVNDSVYFWLDIDDLDWSESIK